MVKFYHIHVPKTGGQSLNQYAWKNKVEWVTNEHTTFPEDSVPDGYTTITALRCPVRHVISMYTCGFIPSNHTPTGYQLLILNHTFSEWLRLPKGPVTGKVRWASYVGFFGNSSDDFDTAVANLKSIDHILDTSRLTKQFNEVIVPKYNLPPFVEYVNRSKAIDITSDDIDYIKKERAADFEICRMFGIEYL